MATNISYFFLVCYLIFSFALWEVQHQYYCQQRSLKFQSQECFKVRRNRYKHYSFEKNITNTPYINSKISFLVLFRQCSTFFLVFIKSFCCALEKLNVVRKLPGGHFSLIQKAVYQLWSHGIPLPPKK